MSITSKAYRFSLIVFACMILPSVARAADCNSNGTDDAAEVASHAAVDCNTNLIPDECDVTGGTSLDCNTNNIPDLCECSDCNTNQRLDLCDVVHGTSGDCDADGTPNECEADCDTNNVPDACQTVGGVGDCNTDHIPDACQLTGMDCDNNGGLDICDTATGMGDCNTDRTPDACQSDCNTNGILDECDISGGSGTDCNTNSFLDVCDFVSQNVAYEQLMTVTPFDYRTSDNRTSFNIAETFAVTSTTSISAVLVHGIFDSSANTPQLDKFVVKIWSHDQNNNRPLAVEYSAFVAYPDVQREVPPCCNLANGPFFRLNLQRLAVLPAGTHWLEVYFAGKNTGIPGVWYWAIGPSPVPNSTAQASSFVNENWSVSTGLTGFKFRLFAGTSDCNTNSLPDECESGDTNLDGLLDVCQDCNTNGTVDRMDPLYLDCDTNGTADQCEILGGTRVDCNTNNTPDMCEVDCNTNQTLDLCEVQSGTQPDCNSNNTPDQCERDCNTNGTLDACDTAGGIGDCNTDGTPDSCQANRDCNSNGTVDTCDTIGGAGDCNTDRTPDSCQGNRDCNSNGIVDVCETIGGLNDCNTDRTPDSCQAAADCNGNLTVDVCDIANGAVDCNTDRTPDTCQADCNFNGTLDLCDTIGGAGDCNTNRIPDVCEGLPDCDTNGLLDLCEIGMGLVIDCNSNGKLDICDVLGAGYKITTASSGTINQAIPDNTWPGGALSTVVVTTSGITSDVNVRVNITHTSDNHLRLYLIRNSTTVTLIGTGVGGSGDNFTDTVLDDQATTAIASGAAPFANTFRPTAPLSVLNGQESHGNWTLKVSDATAGETGTVLSWALIVRTASATDDCNTNGTPDECDIAAGNAIDTNGDSIPDLCQDNCNTNGIPDPTELPDCNTNGIPDSCEPLGADCNTNGTHDRCDALIADCNTNGRPDVCDLSSGQPDCNMDGTLDICQSQFDCNSNCVIDICETAGGMGDCNTNHTPDVCDALAFVDCNTNGTNDICEVTAGTQTDCNSNVVLDVCDIMTPINSTTVHASPTINLSIPDNNTNGVSNTLVVKPFGTLTDVNVRLTISHTNDAHVRAYLTKDGTTVSLIGAASGGTGDNFTGTVFDDSGTTAIIAGTAPFTNTYIPSSPLSALNGQEMHGNWSMRVVDVTAGTVGTFNSWSLYLQKLASRDCNTNGLPDECDLAAGAADTNGDLVLDVCQDCNTNGTPDVTDTATDCNTNAIPDSCESDCNTNGSADVCDLAAGGTDANSNGTLDACEAPGCTTCLGDVDGDSNVDGVDIAGFVRCYLSQSLPGDHCVCADMAPIGSPDGLLTAADVMALVDKLLNDTTPACP